MNNSDKPEYPDPARGAEQSSNNQDPLSLHGGLTKLEEFTKAAMQGLLSNPEIFNHVNGFPKPSLLIEYVTKVLEQLEAKP